MSKKEIKCELKDVSYTVSGKSINDVIALLKKEQSYYKKEGYTNLILDYAGFDEYKKLCIFGNRLETDAEEEERETREKHWQKMREEQDKVEYERLKQKFES